MALNVGQLFVNVTANASGVIAGLSAAERAIERFGSRMYFMGGRIAAGVSVPIIGAMYMIGRTAMEFDSEMTKAMALADAHSRKMRDQYESTAIDLSKQWGFTAAEIAKGYFELHSAAMQGQLAIQGIGIVAQFARSGMMDMQAAGRKLLVVTHAMRPDLDGVTEGSEKAAEKLAYMATVADVLNEVNRISVGTLDTFADALVNKAAPNARMYGMSLTETVAALAAWHQQGVIGRTAGQQFWMVLRDLAAKAVVNAEAFEKAKISVYNAAGEFRHMYEIVSQLDMLLAGFSYEQRWDFIKKGVDPIARMAEVQEKLKTATGKAREELERERQTLTPLGKAWTGKQRTQLLLELGIPQRSIAAITQILGRGGQMQKIYEQLTKSQGRTYEMALEQMTSFSMQMARMARRFDAVKIQLFKAFAPIILEDLLPILEKLAISLERVAVAFGKWPSWIRKAIVGITVFMAVLGPMIMILGSWTLLFGGLQGMVMGLAKAMRFLGAAMMWLTGVSATTRWKALFRPFTLYNFYVARIMAANHAAYGGISKFGAKLVASWLILRRHLLPFLGFTVRIIGGLITRLGLLAAAWYVVAPAIRYAFDWAKKFVNVFSGPTLKHLGKTIRDFVPDDLFSRITKGIDRDLLALRFWVLELTKLFLGAIRWISGTPIKEAFADVDKNAWAALESIAKGIKGWVSALTQGLVDAGKSVVDFLVLVGKGVVQYFVSQLNNALTFIGLLWQAAKALGQWVGGFLSWVGGGLATVGKAIWNTAATIAKGVVQFYTNALKAVSLLVAGVGTVIAGAARGAWEVLSTMASEAMAMARTVGSWVAPVAKAVWNTIADVFRAAGSLTQLIVTEMAAVARTVGTWLSPVSRAIWNVLKDLANAAKALITLMVSEFWAMVTTVARGIANTLIGSVQVRMMLAVEAIRQLWNGLITWLTKQWNTYVVGSINGMIEALPEFRYYFGQMWSDLFQAFLVGWNAMWDGAIAIAYAKIESLKQRLFAAFPFLDRETAEQQTPQYGPKKPGGKPRPEADRLMGLIGMGTDPTSMVRGFVQLDSIISEKVNSFLRGVFEEYFYKPALADAKKRGLKSPTQILDEAILKAQKAIYDAMQGKFTGPPGPPEPGKPTKAQQADYAARQDLLAHLMGDLPADKVEEYERLIWVANTYKDVILATPGAAKRLWEMYEPLRKQVVNYDSALEELTATERQNTLFMELMEDKGVQMFQNMTNAAALQDNVFLKNEESFRNSMAAYVMMFQRMPAITDSFIEENKTQIQELEEFYRTMGIKIPWYFQPIINRWQELNRVQREAARSQAISKITLDYEKMLAEAEDAMAELDRFDWGVGDTRTPRKLLRGALSKEAEVNKVIAQSMADALKLLGTADYSGFAKAVVLVAKMDKEARKLVQAHKMLERQRALEALGIDARFAWMMVKNLASDEAWEAMYVKLDRLNDAWQIQELLVSNLTLTFRSLASAFDKAGTGWLTAIADALELSEKAIAAGKKLRIAWEAIRAIFRKPIPSKSIFSPFAETKTDWKDIAAAVTSAVSAIAEGVALMMQALDTGGRAMRTFKATMVGAQLGQSILPGWGAAIGAGVGFFTGLFYTPGWEHAMNQVGYRYGVKISEGLAKAIEETRGRLKLYRIVGSDQLGRELAALFHISEIIEEEGGLTQQNIEKFKFMVSGLLDVYASSLQKAPDIAAQAFRAYSEQFGTFADFLIKSGQDVATFFASDMTRILDMVAAGMMSASEATMFFKDNFESFTRSVLESGNVASRAFAEMIDRMWELGVATKQITEWITEQAGRAGSAWSAIATGFSTDLKNTINKLLGGDEAYDNLIKKFKEAVSKGFKGTLLDWLKTGNVKLGASEMDRLLAAVKSTSEGMAGLGVLILSTFNQGIAKGMTLTQIMGSLSESLDVWITAMGDLGLPIDDPAMQKLIQLQKLFKENKELMAAVDALKEGTLALSNMGVMSQDTFNALQKTGLATFERLKIKMEEYGLSGEDALRMMVPWLMQMKLLAEQYGFTLDENIDAMIRQAIEAGMMDENTKSSTQRMVEAMERVVTVLEAIADWMGVKLPEAAKKGAKEIEGAFGDIRWPEPGGPGRGGRGGGDTSNPYNVAAYYQPLTPEPIRIPGEVGMLNAYAGYGAEPVVASTTPEPTAAPPVQITVQAWDGEDVMRVVGEKVIPVLTNLWRDNYRSSRTEARTVLGVE